MVFLYGFILMIKDDYTIWTDVQFLAIVVPSFIVPILISYYWNIDNLIRREKGLVFQLTKVAVFSSLASGLIIGVIFYIFPSKGGFAPAEELWLFMGMPIYVVLVGGASFLINLIVVTLWFKRNPTIDISSTNKPH